MRVRMSYTQIRSIMDNRWHGRKTYECIQRLAFTPKEKEHFVDFMRPVYYRSHLCVEVERRASHWFKLYRKDGK